MSKTLLCIITAAALAALSVGVMAARHLVLGNEVGLPSGPGAWKVTLLVKGQCSGEARLTTALPLDFDQQHIRNETYRSEQLAEKPPDLRHSERRQVTWSKRPGTPDGAFRARYEFYCTMDTHHHATQMSRLANLHYAAPRSGEYLDAPAQTSTEHDDISATAHSRTEGLDRPSDQALKLFRYVENEIDNEPSLDVTRMTAAQCLKSGTGNSGGKSRLLLALLRSRGIPARLVTGLTLARGNDQQAHYWVEAWIDEHWLPMCPSHRHYGRVPATYLVFGFGDLPIVRGKHVTDLDYAFLVESTVHHDDAAAGDPSLVRRVFKSLSLANLTGRESEDLVKFLLLLPVAALLICIYRNLIGLNSFGTFAPALLGLAFKDDHSMHQGLLVFARSSFQGVMVLVAILLLGWGMRRLLDYYHILQVPRIAFMLSFIVAVLIAAIILANHLQQRPANHYIALFPLVILTGMVDASGPWKWKTAPSRPSRRCWVR